MAAGPSVEKLVTSVYRIPTDRPEADGTLVWDATTMVLVQVSADGHLGMGWTYGAAAAAGLINDVLADVVSGASALDVSAVNEAMHRAVRNIGRPGIAAMAISAVDTSLWDLKARLLGVRLASLLGAVDSAVPVYGSGGFTTYDSSTLARQLDGWTQQGIPRVKIKIGESWGRAVHRDLSGVREARQVIGADTELYVDANGAYTRKQAIRVAHAAADADIAWFEEPASSDDLDGLREVRDAVSPDVAAGEYGYDLAYFERMCAADAVDCLQADVSRCGGIAEWQRVAAVAAARNLQISGHCAPHLHLDAAAATVNLRHLEWFHDHAPIESMLFDGSQTPIGGVLHTDTTALGNGLTFRQADAERYRIG